MSGGYPHKLVAWSIALTLLALPILGVLNGWFASDRWPVTRLNVNAEFDHVSAEQIRAAAQPLLGKGFFALDLDHVRDAVVKLPWVERAEVRKRWPDSVDLLVYEQQPYALWGAERLINRQGHLFSVAGAQGLQGLPRLRGPDDRLDDVLRFYAECLREFSGSGMVIDAIALSPRGGWRIELASGSVIELGRDDAQRRLKRFLDVWPRLAGTHANSPAYVDLRYENGFAMRWPAPTPAEPAPAGNRELGIGNGQTPTAAFRHMTSSPQLAALSIPDSPLPIPSSNPDSRLPIPGSP
jgi:cell division protein FtsQ